MSPRGVVRRGLRRWIGAVLLPLFALATAWPHAAAAALLPFDDDERAAIAALGPWPPAPATDPGNPVAGQAAAIALGERLFFDAGLARDGRSACAACHRPALAFTDGRARSVGRAEVDRNAPSLWNAVHERWYGWDGAADSLWSQALRALVDPREMATDGARLREHVLGRPELACHWRQVFGEPAVNDEQVLVDAARAIGAFVATLVSGPTPFDRFREALVRGDPASAARYPAAAQRGLKLFIGRGRCHFCHQGPRFSNGEFADIGAGFFAAPGRVDSGRHGGIQALRASRYNLLSSWGEGAGEAATKTRHVQLQHRHFGEFKVPSLRNVAETAPYLHDGRLPTLDAVLRHYSELDLDRLHADGQALLEPLHLGRTELADLGAFLHTLSDPGARRWRPTARQPCR